MHALSAGWLASNDWLPGWRISEPASQSIKGVCVRAVGLLAGPGCLDGWLALAVYLGCMLAGPSCLFGLYAAVREQGCRLMLS